MKGEYIQLNFLEKRWIGPTIALWADGQCTNLGSRPFNLLACQEECLATTGCNSIQYKNDGISATCTLRACNSAVPGPSAVDNAGYWYYDYAGMFACTRRAFSTYNYTEDKLYVL